MQPAAGDLRAAAALMLHWADRDISALTQSIALMNHEEAKDALIALLILGDLQPAPSVLRNIIYRSALRECT